MQKETYNVIKESKDKGLKVFYERYSKKLFSYSISHLKLDEDEAWNLIYSSFEKIMTKVKSYTFESEAKFGAFVLVVFLNDFRNLYKSRKKEIQFDFSENIDDYKSLPQEPENSENDSEKMCLLKRELEKLEDWQRMLLLLKAQQMPYSQIAEYVQKPENQLKVYYARLKKKLMENILSTKEVPND
jgi:RNA polymerase sigma-70 factor (ECF subfamily)